MESFSSRPDEEELDELHNKPIGDLLDLRLAGGKEEEENNKNKAKKKKRYTMSQEHVELLLSYKLKPLPEHKTVDRLVDEDENTFGGLRTAIMGCHDIWKEYENIILARQQKITHDLETKGCVTYEATHEIAYDMVALATNGCVNYEAAHDIADDDEDASPAAGGA